MKTYASIIRLLSAALLFFVPAFSHAQNYISEEALFYRCYGQMTQLRPKLTDPLVLQVKAGTKTAIQACTEVFDSAKLSTNNNTKIVDENNLAAKAVLNSFYHLHRSWAREQVLTTNTIGGNVTVGTNAWYENSPMGAYITRALFSPVHDVNSVITGTDFVQPVRTTLDPPHVANGVPNPTATVNPTDWLFGVNQPFAPRGELLGIRSISVPPVTWTPAVPIGNSIPDFSNIGTSPVATIAWTDINFADVTALSAPIAPQTTQFAIRARGSIQIPTTGQYSFFVTADDSAQMVFDGLRLTSPTPFDVTAGSHTFEIHYLQRTSGARLNLAWQGPGIAKQTVPASAFSGLNADYYTQMGVAPTTFSGNEGGGFIGNHNYLMTTFNETNTNYVPDGQLVTNRSFARAVLKDSMCREVPVVRESDAAPFVIPASTTPFRQEAACTACHATLDRLANGTIRGLRWNLAQPPSVASPAVNLFGIADVKIISPSYSASTDWPGTAETDYGRRAPYGHLFFRNYRGELVDEIIHSLAELGSAISRQDDFYTCFAKRYYNYFLGIDVPLEDPGDPAFPKLNITEEYQRAKVIQLGLKLKSHKSLRQLVLDIIGSDEYRMSDYGIAYGGPADGK